MRIRTAVASLAALGLATAAWSVVEARWYAVREFEVPILPAGHRPIRILHLADLHLMPNQQQLVDWVRDLDRFSADFVINTGDNWAHPQSLPALMSALEPHLRRPGAFVFGSNDYYAPHLKNPLRYLFPETKPRETPTAELPWSHLVEQFTQSGWLDLTNQRGMAQIHDTLVSFVGTDDAHLGRDRFPVRSLEAHPVDLHLGVTHAPYRRVLDQMSADGVDLALAGHTHGGQVAVPGWGALVTNCDLDTNRAKGLHGWPGARPDQRGGGSMWLHVSAGLGTSPYTPIRFACRPEASLLTLTPWEPSL